jgi:hypothetical protein
LRAKLAAKPIRVIVPFRAGSTIDIVARIVFEPLGRQLGQALVIENRGGASGEVAGQRTPIVHCLATDCPIAGRGPRRQRRRAA